MNKQEVLSILLELCKKTCKELTAIESTLETLFADSNGTLIGFVKAEEHFIEKIREISSMPAEDTKDFVFDYWWNVLDDYYEDKISLEETVDCFMNWDKD